MAAPPIWDQLSQSSKLGLRYAWAAALCRADGAAEVEVSSFDFLIGMLLSHPGTSEAEQTFRRFGLVAGQALPASYPDITPDQLKRNLVGLPTDAPPMSSEVLEILNRAAELDSRTDSMASQVAKVETVTELRYLWVALLSVTNEAQVAIRALLTGRGVNFENLTSQTQAWLDTADRVGYDTVLQEFSAIPVDIVNYKADLSRNPDPAADPTRVEDFVGNSAEVDAFAYLLASRNLEPPLAVGLFGDWGSGKSYFLDAIKRRIDQLTRNEELARVDQRDTPFWKRIVQVDFNAWHYIEGDLWSSLVDNILGQLNLASENRTDDVVVQRREYLLEQIKNKTAKVTVLAQQQQDLERDLERNEAQLRDLRANQRAAEAELEAKRTEHTAAEIAAQSRQVVIDALAAVELGPVSQPTTLGDAARALEAAHAELNNGWSLFRPFIKEPSWATVLVLVCLVLAPLLAVVVAQQAQSLLGGALTGVSTLIAACVGSLGAATRWLRARNKTLAEATSRVDEELKREQQAKQREVRQAEQRRDEARARVVAREAALDQTQAELVSVQNDLGKAPQVVLNEFLRARLDAGEYRKRLGVPAIVRDDFKDLAELISYQNEYLLRPSLELQKRFREKSGADILPANDQMIINRIILYIDDLDRCPDSKVIEVLQAVHLLLAFPLFVVVVAVDARWLAHALQSRYPRSPVAGSPPAVAPCCPTITWKRSSRSRFGLTI